MKTGSQSNSIFDRLSGNRNRTDYWESKYFSVLKNSSSPIIELDKNKITFLNQSARVLLNVLDEKEEYKLSEVFAEDSLQTSGQMEASGRVHVKKTNKSLEISVKNKFSSDNYLFELKEIPEIVSSEILPEMEAILEDINHCFFSKMREGFVLVDKDGRILFMNDNFAAMTGYSKEELKTLKFTNITPEKWHSYELEIIQNLFHKQELFVYEKEYIHKDGHVFPIEIQVSRLERNNKILGFWGIVRDITIENQTKNKLKKSEETYREIFNSSQNLIIVQDMLTRKFIDVNQAALEKYGYSKDEMLGKSVGHFSSGEAPYSQKYSDELVEQVKKEKQLSFLWRDKRKDGELFWTQNFMKVASLHGQEHILVFSTDITNEKETHDELLQTKQFLEAAIKQSPSAIVIADAGTSNIRYSNLNPSWIPQTVRDEVQNTVFEYLRDFHFRTPEGIPIKVEELPLSRAIIKGETVNNFECRAILENKSEIWFSTNASPIKDTDGKIIAGIIIMSDISDKKKAEMEIVESKLMLETVLDTIPVRVFWKDKKSTFLGCNKRFLKDAGLENVNQIIGKTDYDLIWKEQADNYKSDDFDVISSGIAKLEYEELQTTPDGHKIWLRTSKIPLKNHVGETIGILGAYDDITEFKTNLIELEKHQDHLEMLVAERTEEIARINNEIYDKNKELFDANHLLVREIDERIQIEEKLKQSEETFRSFIEQSDQGICLFDSDGKIIEWNIAMSVLFETSREKYIGHTVWEFDYDFLPENLKSSDEKTNTHQSTIEYFRNPHDRILIDELARKVNQKLKYIQRRIFPIETSKGKIFGGINLDITDKKAVEIELEKYRNDLEKLVEQRTQALKKGEANIRLVMQSVPIAFYSYDPLNKENTLWYSEQIENISGYKKEKLIENPGLWESKIHKDDFQKARLMLDNMATRDQFSSEYRWIDASGKIIWIQDQAVMIEGTENYPRQIIGCFWDITDRKNTERAIMESESNYREIFNSSTDSIFIYDAISNKVEDVNDTLLAMFGCSYEEALSYNPIKFYSSVTPYDSTKLLEHIKHALVEGMHRFEWLARRVDGTLFWTDIILKRIILNGEEKLMAVIRDIDEKKKNEQQIKYRNDFEKLIFDISSRFINMSYIDVDMNINNALSEICSFTQADSGYMFRISDNNTEFNVTHLWQDEKMKINPNQFQKLSSEAGKWQVNKVRENYVVKVNNVDSYKDLLPELKMLYRQQNVNSFVDVPMIYQDTMYGYFGLASNNSNRQWSEDEISLIRATGQIFVNAIKRKESVEALIISELSHREIYNATTEAIIVLDLKNGKITDVNRAMLDMFDYSYSEALDSSYKDLLVSRSKYSSDNFQQLIDKTIHSGPQVFEWYIKKKDGLMFWAEVSLKIAEIKGIKSLLLVLRDISERKNAEENQRESEEKYRLLIEGQTDLVIKFDPDGLLLFASPSYCDLFGKKEEELIGKSIMPFMHPKDNEALNEFWQNLLNPPFTSHTVLRGFTKHGWRWLAWNDKAVLDENNKVKEIIGVGRDITYQKGVEDALRQSEDRFRSIVQQLSDIVFILDKNGEIQYDTPSIKNVLGYDEGFLIGKSSIDFIHPDDRKIAVEKGRALATDNQQAILAELRMKHSDGRWIPLETIGINMLQHPSINGLVITCRDISERKMVEKRILDAIIKTEERERERFAKNLHDDLGPLLSSIKMYVNSFSSRENEKKRRYIVEQLNEVVKEAIVTTKEVSNDLSPHVLLNYGLNSAIESFLNKVPETIHVQFESDITTERFPNTIENSSYRIVKELVNNTLKHAKAENINLKVSLNSDILLLDYNDDGIGFNINELESLHNKGMGLSNIISRVKSLNGNFEIKNKQKKGFACQIKIPINQSIN